jgi:hypothetical protein
MSQQRLTLWGSLLVVVVGCAAASRLVEPATKMTCVVLRARTTSGTVDEICATAEELAPLVPELLAERAEAEGPKPSRAFVAFALEAPAEPVTRRRCVAWRSLELDGGPDAAR